MLKVVSDEHPDLAGWVLYSNLSGAPAPFVSYADVAGTYESEDERIVLTKDGMLRWSVLGQDSYLEYNYLIGGYCIYQNVEVVGADAQPDYFYDPVKKVLSSYGTVYSRK